MRTVRKAKSNFSGHS